MGRPGIRRLVKGGALALGAVIALALVLVLGAVIIVKSSWGTERVRQLVLSRLNASLAGQIEVQRLAFPIAR